ncbi:Uncharacterized protein TCAP_06784 [Tolypocladium capitatum]|uniref:Helicase C-terminal domain-containing protein n=1 Tax=Tolypocladium capitatum TaxID=45235 RepID=A0A2K3Q6X3_9HYPO|nr:Uncharacterized protein TCAP_06784 [Tolypocladium capitatum]
MAGYATLHITSRTEQAERDTAVRRFSEKGSPYCALITSTTLNAYGVDFHRDCHVGLMVEEPPNTATAMQAIGRLYRLGQTDDVEFERVILRHSYDSAMEARNLHKYATTVAAHAEIDPRIDVMDHPMSQLEGLFYTELARFLMKHPELSTKVSKENIAGIAKAWKPGMAFTAKHVEGGMPELEDGVALRPFEPAKVDMTNAVMVSGDDADSGDGAGDGAGGDGLAATPRNKSAKTSSAESARKRALGAMM